MAPIAHMSEAVPWMYGGLMASGAVYLCFRVWVWVSACVFLRVRVHVRVCVRACMCVAEGQYSDSCGCV